MIGQYLSNTNKNATVSILQQFLCYRTAHTGQTALAPAKAHQENEGAQYWYRYIEANPHVALLPY